MAVAAFSSPANPKSESSPRPLRLSPTEWEVLLKPLAARIKPVRVGLFYRLGLLLVALAMVILPLAYVALVAAAGYAVAYYAVHGLAVFQEMHSQRGALFVYVAPLLIGFVLLFFMVKPLLARRALAMPPRALKPEDEPRLYEFVNRLCKALGAPRPSRIWVDCDVNASAALRPGILRWIMGDLILTIGLPLAAGLNLSQLTGVLAHEFGHFSQGGAMRLTNLIRRINMWFARVVYERDQWDEQLVKLSRQVDIRFGVIFLVARLFIWCTRRILWVLMYIGHVLSCFMMRQMEYHADGYEARAVGSEAFEETFHRILLLDFAAHMARVDLAHAWNEKRLGNNLPALIAANHDRIPGEKRNEMIEKFMSGKTRLFSTHPSDRVRIERVRQKADEGIFHDDRPASLLFRDFEGLCQTVSMDYYVGVLGPQVRQGRMESTEQMVQGTQTIRQGHEAVERYLNDYIHPLRPLPFGLQDLTPPADPRAVALEVRKAREMFVSLREGAEAGFKALEEADRRFIDGVLARALLTAKFRLKAGSFQLKKANLPEAEAQIKRAAQEVEDVEIQLKPFEDAIKRRMMAALRLLHTPQVRSRVEGGERLLAEAERVHDSLRQFQDCKNALDRSRQLQGSLHILLGNLKGHEEDAALIKTILSTGARLREEMKTVQMMISSAFYPFDHANGSVSLAQYAVPDVPAEQEIGQLAEKSEQMMEKLFAYYYRAVGSLALTAEKVEQVLGLEPISKSNSEPTKD